MSGSGITRSEMRGLIVLAAVLTAIVGFTALFGGRGYVPESVPVEIQAKMDSIAAVDSLKKFSEGAGKENGERSSAKKRKKRTPVADRPSPLDREVQ